MNNKLLMSILFTLFLVGILSSSFNMSRVAADPTTLYIDPSPVTKGPGDFGTPFTVSVKIQDVSDLFGFDMKITWDNTVITFSSLDNTSLSTVFGSYFEPLTPPYQSGAGYVRFAAVKTGSPPGFTGSGTLFTLTFIVARTGNFPYSTLIQFDAPSVKLSDSNANSISATLTSGQYSMSATVPDIDFTLVNPHPAKPYEYGKYFEVQVYVSHITSTIVGFDLKVDYTSELLSFYGVHDWDVLGTGTTDTSVTGVVHITLSSSLTPYTGDRGLLFTLTFKVTFDDRIGHIWRSTSPHTLAATVSLDTSYGDLSFTEGTLNINGSSPTPVTPPPPVNLTINLIQGDVNCDGSVDIYDLRAVAAYYDQSVPPAPAKYDLKTDGTMDIFDLVEVASNFNYNIPDVPP
jgi:hypothetical protein